MAVLDLLPGRKKEVAPEPPKPKPVHKGRLIIPTGRLRSNVVEWSMDDPESVKLAKRRFMEVRNVGYAAFESFEVPNNYGGGTKMSQPQSTQTFDPQATEISMTAAFAGG